MIGSSILVSILTLLGGLISLLNQLVMARLFGASESMDAYLIAISIPTFVSGLLSAVLSYSLVPALMTHASDDKTYRRFSGLLLLSFIGVSTAITVAGFVATPTQIEILGAALSIEAKENAILIARISWGTVGPAIVVGHLNAMHNASKRFLLPVVASIFPFACMIVGGMFFGSTHGPSAVALGMFAGFLLAIPALLIRSLHTLDISAQCLLLWKDVAGYLFHVPLVVLAMLCFTVYQSIDAYWAPRVGTGNLAYIGYSQKLLIAIGSLIIAGPSAVLLPRLAEAYANGRIKELLNDTGRALRTVIAFALPVAVFVSILAAPLVRLLFERGAFDYEATKGVAAILPFMMIGMIAMLCVVIVFRALFSKHDVTRASMLGILATVLYFTLSGLLSQRLGVKGIALAYASSWWLVLLLSALSLWRGNMALLFCKENFVFIGKLFVISVVIGVVMTWGRIWIGGTEGGSGMLLLQMILIGALACVVYLTVAICVIRVEEVHLIYAFLYSKVESLMTRSEKKGI